MIKNILLGLVAAVALSPLAHAAQQRASNDDYAIHSELARHLLDTNRFPGVQLGDVLVGLTGADARGRLRLDSGGDGIFVAGDLDQPLWPWLRAAGGRAPLYTADELRQSPFIVRNSVLLYKPLLAADTRQDDAETLPRAAVSSDDLAAALEMTARFRGARLEVGYGACPGTVIFGMCFISYDCSPGSQAPVGSPLNDPYGPASIYNQVHGQGCLQVFSW